MNKEKWQQELSQLQLTETQKHRMKQSVKTSPKRKVDWTYRIAVPTFVILSLFFVYLFIGERSDIELINQVTIPPFDTDHEAYFNHLNRHLLIIFLLLVGNCMLGVLVLMRTVRWQHPFILTLRKSIQKLRYVLLFIIPISAVVLIYLLFIFNWQVFSLKLTIISLVLCLHIFVLLYLARHIQSAIHCPHCKHAFSNKEKRKIATYFKMELNCPSCDKNIYYSKNYRQMTGIASFTNVLTIFIVANIGVSFTIILPIIILYTIFLLFGMFPLFIELDAKEEFMW